MKKIKSTFLFLFIIIIISSMMLPGLFTVKEDPVLFKIYADIDFIDYQSNVTMIAYKNDSGFFKLGNNEIKFTATENGQYKDKLQMNFYSDVTKIDNITDMIGFITAYNERYNYTIVAFINYQHDEVEWISIMEFGIIRYHESNCIIFYIALGTYYLMYNIILREKIVNDPQWDKILCNL